LNIPKSATLLSARKIIDALDWSKPNPGKDFFIDRAIKEAAAILGKIDQISGGRPRDGAEAF
jgi:hypothetical protein